MSKIEVHFTRETYKTAQWALALSIQRAIEAGNSVLAEDLRNAAKEFAAAEQLQYGEKP